MKTMTCNQLGGACEVKFTAEIFDQIAAKNKQHGMEMFQKQDKPHLEAMNKMKSLMQLSDAMQDWFDPKRKEFEALPND